MAEKAKILFEWHRPMEIAIRASDDLLKQGKRAIPLVLTITAGLLFFFYFFINHYFREYLPPEFADNLIKILSALFLISAVLILYTFWLAPMQILIIPYVITEDCIAAKGCKPWRLRWDSVDGYSVRFDDEFLDVVFLRLHHRKSWKEIAITMGELSAGIIDTVAARVPFVEKSYESLDKPKLFLSVMQWFYLWLLTIVYSICAGYLINKLGYSFRILLLGVFIVGPGTLGVVTLVGKKILKERQPKAYAIAFNAFAFLLGFFCWFLFQLNDLIKEVCK
jgi:hypothetical protein